MPKKTTKARVLMALAAAGMLVALFSALETRIPWIAELCGVFGGGCRETASFTLFGVSIAFIGLAYYAVLAAALLFLHSQVFRLVMAGAGVELLFLYTMADQGIFCPFCILNFLVIAALVAGTFQRRRGWEALALALLFLTGLSLPFTQENGKVDHASPPPSPEDPAVVARVDGAPVTAPELERATASRVYDARMNLYIQQRAQLDHMVNERLLSKEAERLEITTEELRNRVLAEVEPVKADDIEGFLLENPRIAATWEGTEVELRARVRSHLEGKRKTEVLKRYYARLRQGADVRILLEEPPLPWTRVSLGNSPSQGPPDAPVTVVEFSDYLCPACRKAHETSMAIREAFRGRIRWVFKDYPLERHEGSRDLAEAARCARDQGLFWDFQDMLFMAEVEVDRERLSAFAADMGMDTAVFEQCLESGKHREDILADIRSGEEAGVAVTPTFIINGKMRPGTPSPKELRSLIETELSRSGSDEALP